METPDHTVCERNNVTHIRTHAQGEMLRQQSWEMLGEILVWGRLPYHHKIDTKFTKFITRFLLVQI